MEPLIKTKPPGPEAVAVLERDARVISQSMARQYPLVLKRAEGVNLWDVDGNRYLDFTAGFAVMNIGWSHPKVVSAIQQARCLSHAAFLAFCSELPVMFAERLVELLPRSLNRVCLANSGAESVEAALKLARYHSGRPHFIAFYNAFHGRTYGALSLTATKSVYRARFGPFMPVIHAPFPNPYRPAYAHQSPDAHTLLTLTEEIFAKEVAPEEVAAIFVEPIQGEGGYIVPPKQFLRELRALCDEHGILLVADEVQTGCYRTGTFLASEQFGVTPDIVCLSKALGGGLPLGAMVASDEVTTWVPGSHASTFAGNNLACAAGLAVLDIFSERGFGEHVVQVGKHLLRGLRETKDTFDLVGDARGLGLMAAIELVRNRTTKTPAAEERKAIVADAFENGLALLAAGDSAIRFCPPLTIDKDDIDVGLAILNRCLAKSVERR
ncbi:MAG TPA: acetyl ornithine aminotransferase family protein [Candidatus Bathyarchaeia archaeon]|nr:acetyl ornithine aminotransferase family protein [Candidatus Bathyarchaeia archaeon]